MWYGTCDQGVQTAAFVSRELVDIGFSNLLEMTTWHLIKSESSRSKGPWPVGLGLGHNIIMRPSSLGGAAYCVALCLSVCPSVCLSVCPVIVFVYFTLEPSYERTSKIEKILFSLMGQRHVCTFRHAQRAAYRTAISAAQILVFFF